MQPGGKGMDRERMIRGSKPEPVFETDMVVPRTNEACRQWDQVRLLLRNEFGETAYSTWLSPLDLVQIDGDRAVITVRPSSCASGWSTTTPTASAPFGPASTPWCAASRSASRRPCRGPVPPGRPAGVRPRIVADNSGGATALDGDGPAPSRPAAEPQAASASLPDLAELGASLDPRFTFDASSSASPTSSPSPPAERMAACEKPPFNPLFLYGGVGLGKTHLMHAIGWQAKQTNPDRRVVTSRPRSSWCSSSVPEAAGHLGFKEMFRSVDLLMVDDVQFISGKDSTRRSSSTPSTRWPSAAAPSSSRRPEPLRPRRDGGAHPLAPRLGAGRRHPPTTYELRVGIPPGKAERLGAAVQPEVFEFLAHRITSNVRELEGALNRVVHQATLLRRPGSIDMAQDVLKDLLRSNERRVTIEEIQRAVVEHYQLKMSDMQSSRRARAVARPRQVAMYLAKQLTPRSLPEIGKKFGGRDHTTVMHAVKQIERLCETDRSLADDVAALRRRLSG
jgi:chromosomal replication initiator protein